MENLNSSCLGIQLPRAAFYNWTESKTTEPRASSERDQGTSL